MSILRSKFRAASILIFLLIVTTSLFAIETQKALTTFEILKMAIKGGETEEINMLIEDGVSINQPFEDGVYPLHVAVINNQESVVKLLLEAGAKPNVADQTTGASPLHLAALYGRTEIAKLLLQKGANVDASMKFNITPLLVAAQFNQAEVLELFIDHKANIQHADQEGFTALHFAAQNGNAFITQLLVNRGAKTNLKDKTKNSTPLNIAKENHHENVVQILERTVNERK